MWHPRLAEDTLGLRPFHSTICVAIVCEAEHDVLDGAIDLFRLAIFPDALGLSDGDQLAALWQVQQFLDITNVSSNRLGARGFPASLLLFAWRLFREYGTPGVELEQE